MTSSSTSATLSRAFGLDDVSRIAVARNDRRPRVSTAEHRGVSGRHARAAARGLEEREHLRDVRVPHEPRVEREELQQRGVHGLDAEAGVEQRHARGEPGEQLRGEAVGAQHGLGPRLHVGLEHEGEVEHHRPQQGLRGRHGLGGEGHEGAQQRGHLPGQADDVQRRAEPHALMHDAHERARRGVGAVEGPAKELQPERPDLAAQALHQRGRHEGAGLLPRGEERVEFVEHRGQGLLRRGRQRAQGGERGVVDLEERAALRGVVVGHVGAQHRRGGRRARLARDVAVGGAVHGLHRDGLGARAGVVAHGVPVQRQAGVEEGRLHQRHHALDALGDGARPRHEQRDVFTEQVTVAREEPLGRQAHPVVHRADAQVAQGVGPVEVVLEERGQVALLLGLEAVDQPGALEPALRRGAARQAQVEAVDDPRRDQPRLRSHGAEPRALLGAEAQHREAARDDLRGEGETRREIRGVEVARSKSERHAARD